MYWAKEFAALPIKRDRAGVLYFPMDLNQRRAARRAARNFHVRALMALFRSHSCPTNTHPTAKL